MKIVLLGVQGCGKGTQAKNLTEILNIPHISTGDIFRSAIASGSELGTEAKQYIDKGILVPDEITISLVENKLKSDDCKNGFILDGFPRNLVQGKALNDIINLDLVVYFNLSINAAIERITNRLTCSRCSTPAIPNVTVCEKCGGSLVKRTDDSDMGAIQTRITDFLEQTMPLLELYNSKGIVRKLDSSGSIESTTMKMKEIIGEFCD